MTKKTILGKEVSFKHIVDEPLKQYRDAKAQRPGSIALFAEGPDSNLRKCRLTFRRH